MRLLIVAIAALMATSVKAQDVDLSRAIDTHILPGFDTLARASDEFATAAQDDCTPTNPALRTAYGTAFDAFVTISHLRFGPTELDNRAFALAFWPDPRGSTPKTLGKLISDADPVAQSVESYNSVSIAARGFYALEFLLYDPQFLGVEKTDYRCLLIQTASADIAVTTQAILQDWQGDYARLLRTAGENDTYRTKAEATRQLFTALSTGLEFTSSARLGRPLGTFDRPRPKRAEVHRSARSLRHVVLSLNSTRTFAAILSDGDPQLDALFARALERANAISDPAFQAVTEPQARIRVEGLQRAVDDIRKALAIELGPQLGVSAGFNSLDGD